MHTYDAGIAAGSDHAPVVADLVFDTENNMKRNQAVK
jgi:hypothetical protein